MAARREGQQPFFLHRKDNEPFGFAGLWEQWHQDGEVIDSCTIITSEANTLMESIHNRMPVILGKQHHEAWLTGKPDDAYALLQPCPPDWQEAVPVSTFVNNVRNNAPQCIEPLAGGSVP